VNFVEWFEEEKDRYLKVSSSDYDVPGGNFNPDTVRQLQYLNCASSHGEILSYILYKKFDEEPLLRELFRLSSVLAMRFELANEDNRIQRDTMYSTASKIRDKKDTSEVRQVLKNRIREETPSDNKIKREIINNKMSFNVWKFRTRLILASIEESRDSSKTVNLNNLHIDHIAPRRTFSKEEYYEWRQRHSKEGFSDRCNRIGNLALLTEEEHRELKESSFTDKIRTYRNSQISTTRGIAKNFENWNDEKIEERSKLMAEGLVNCWSV
jgi:hypothetical protein